MTKHPEWIVVADGEHARILVPTSERPDTYHTIDEITSKTAHLRTSDLVSDTAGRTFESAAPGRHAIAPHHDPHVTAKHDFVTRIAAYIGVAAKNNLFERLVLVAPARALHDLRADLPPEAQSRLIGVLQHDLTKVSDHDIGKHLTWDVMHGGTLTE